LAEFYRGVRRTVLAPGELLREIRVPPLTADQRGTFLKLGLRQAQAIAVINVALVLTFAGETVGAARIALGCVAPTIVRAGQAEAYLSGRALDAATCAEAGRRATTDAAPIDDVRSTAGYRTTTVAALVRQGLERLGAGTQAADWMDAPVLLDTGATPATTISPFNGAIHTSINGRDYTLPAAASGKTLLNALREDAGLTGTKEGCAEGECGACTVWLDGRAVMACLVPAPQAHGARVTTIEGLAAAHAQEAALHPLQAAFIACGAVQCGYCIPGMLMAGAKLLAEHPQPDLARTQVALSGNICRCTGYRKILDAVQQASQPAGGAA
jgi:carbon-monoxide dehydrogenase medium subunit